MAAGVLSVALGLYNNVHGGRESGALLLIPLAAMGVAELLRRIGQPWALVIAVPALAADVLLGSLLATVVMFTDVVYASVLYGSRRLGRFVMIGSWLLIIGATIGTLAAFRRPEALLVGAVVGAVTLTPAWTGQILRAHRERADAERLRAEQTTLLAEMDRREAVTAERARMARELHDMVANHLSAIAIHSSAALSLNDPAASKDALGVIRENSVQGLSEMRRLIGLLREAGGDDAAAPSAAPTLQGLPALIEQARTNGTASGLHFTLTDERAADASPAAPVELAAYRIVQESLTNALKHAGPGEVAVDVAGTDPLTVTVTSPLGERDGPRAPGSGAGLIGMEERCALLGGTFSAGPEGDRWIVRAELPGGAEQGS
ncbi:two-component sensor histidine kinase [Streptomyces sp. A7024]|uniref:histidine kinase n=2 Tax=Streptomyces coryli TaxID=1128680 RepID=A0A6G4U1S3_9ACTN|nr:histidine kinase [Streptomyces coryli]NGN66185.1 two-component sensor histidine kinase [Streptomyces coryli]